ncbi:bifunctional DNA primase/polymerase [Niabella sp.]|uniref:bifunctional DNA primase/polymerase n=1 Tax=Niabella sp. TaxID=1962976 RepID=UPI00262742BE|nr:bifunctional DNA primase/polymerase [Niabella sp.]
MNSLINTAMQYREMGFSVIATDALKQSIAKWKGFQDQLPGAAALEKMFSSPAALGIALVTGRSSGNLEVIDVDTKYFTEGCQFVKFCAGIAQVSADLFKKIVIAQSRNGGYHFYYRCNEIGPNQALARRPVTEQEKLRHPKERVKVLIETRGIGGYIVVPPSPGYRFVQNDLSRIPSITASERNALLHQARILNQYVEKKVEKSPSRIRAAGEMSPLDDYNQRGDIIGLLEKHGWTVVGRNEKRTWLKRPGDSDKRSSGDFNHEMGLFSVFSTSSEFKPGCGYRPYAVYAVLECGGDFKEAVRRLAGEGFGVSPIVDHQRNNNYNIKI